MKRILTVIAIIFFITPTLAYGYVPFGGRIMSDRICTCPAYRVTQMTIMTARGPIVLDYAYGTQGYLGYNLPNATNLKGFYGTGSVCWDYIGKGCKLRMTPPSVGTLFYVVGSSSR